MSTPQSIIDTVSTPFFDIDNIRITELSSGGFYLANLLTRSFHFIGAVELEILRLCDGKKTIKEIAQVGPVKDENRMCKFIVAAFSLGILGDPPPRRRNWFLLTFSLFNPSRIFKPENKLSTYLRNILYFLALISLIFSIVIMTTNFDMIIEFFFTPFFLNPWNWIFVFVGFLLTGFFHEFAHVITLTSYGLPSIDMGFALALFQPAAYADVTGIRRVQSKTKRLFVWLAGIFMQFILVAIALAFLSFATLSNAWQNFFMIFLFVNFMLIALNLLFSFRFDGYHVLRELLNIQSLREEAMEYVANITNERYRTLTEMRKFIHLLVGVLSYIFPIVVPAMIITDFLPNFFPILNPIVEMIFPFVIGGTFLFFSIRYLIRRRRRA